MLFIRNKIKNLLYNGQYYNSYFNHCINNYKKIVNYITLFENILETSNIIKTNSDINYSSDVQFGMQLSKVRSKITVPNRLVKNPNLCDIIFYKTDLENQKFIVELHFFKQKLVFFKYIFPPTTDKEKIKKLIQHKYFNQKTNIDIEKILITDTNKNYMKLENSVNFSICYFSLNFGFYNFLIENKKQINQCKVSKQNLVYDKLRETI